MFKLFLLIIFALKISIAQGSEIADIFIDSGGNNKYEAKIKAHEQGMLRAFILTADQFGINSADLKEPTYETLKNVFKPTIINNEVSTAEHYAANVTYGYKKGDLYQLFLEFGNSTIDDKFYEYLVIPVFKQGNTINIWESQPLWQDLWMQNKKLLNRNKLLLAPKTLLISKKITPENIYTLGYIDFLDIFNNLFFKNVMIVTIEFFTERATGEAEMKINQVVIYPKPKEPNSLSHTYNLASPEEVPSKVNSFVAKIVRLYGKLRKNPETQVNTYPSAGDEQSELTPLVMNFEAYSQEELDILVSKLKKVEQVDHFEIKNDFETCYKVLIYSSVSPSELAEGFYLNGLSYKVRGDIYNLIDVKKGS